MEDFRWNIRIRSSGNECAQAYARKHQFQVGSPLNFDTEYEHLTALEYALGAIGADVVNSIRSIGRRRRVEIDNVEAVVSGRLNNPLTHLGVVGEDGHPGLEYVSVRVYLSSPAEDDAIQSVWKEMLEKSPLVQTFQRCLSLDLQLQVVL